MKEDCSALLSHIESALGNLETYQYVQSPVTAQIVQKTVENYLHSLNTVAASKVRCKMGSDHKLHVDIELQPVRPVYIAVTALTINIHDYYDHRTFV